MPWTNCTSENILKIGTGTLFWSIDPLFYSSILLFCPIIIPSHYIHILPYYSFPLSRAICSRLSLGCVSTSKNKSYWVPLLGFGNIQPLIFYHHFTESSDPGKAQQTGYIKQSLIILSIILFFYACSYYTEVCRLVGGCPVQ